MSLRPLESVEVLVASSDPARTSSQSVYVDGEPEEGLEARFPWSHGAPRLEYLMRSLGCAIDGRMAQGSESSKQMYIDFLQDLRTKYAADKIQDGEVCSSPPFPWQTRGNPY